LGFASRPPGAYAPGKILSPFGLFQLKDKHESGQ